MLHGYEAYRLQKGISPGTLVTEVELLKTFVQFVNTHNQKQMEPYEIKPSDVRTFMDQEKAKGLKSSTLKRKLSQIKQYFHFLWKIGKVPVDFMPKFEYELVVPKATATLYYEDFLNVKNQVLMDSSVLLNARLYFLFAMKGFRMKEIERLQSKHFQDMGDVIEMNFVTSQEVLWQLEFADSLEVAVLSQALERSIFREHDYLVASDKKFGADYVRRNLKDIYARLNGLLPKPFKTEEVRSAYVYFLYEEKGRTFDEMVNLLGVSPETLTFSLKLAFERYK